MYLETHGCIRAVVPRQRHRSEVLVSFVTVLLATDMVLLGGNQGNHICWGKERVTISLCEYCLKKEKGDLIFTSQAKSKMGGTP